MTVRFPAFCPNCGAIFESSAIGIEGGASATVVLEGSRETCPVCGSWAELPDGMFNIVGDTIQVLSTSRLTEERLRRLTDVLGQANSGAISPDAAAEAIMREAPSLGPLIEKYAPRMQRALFVFLYVLAPILLSQGLAELRDDSATKEDVRSAVEQAVNECQRR